MRKRDFLQLVLLGENGTRAFLFAVFFINLLKSHLFFAMETDSSLHMQVALSFLPRFNRIFALPFFERCGGIEGFFLEKEEVLQTLSREWGFRQTDFRRKEALEKAEQEIGMMDKLDIRICSVEHHRYPFLLKQCEDAPLVLYYKGTWPVADEICLAVVGTRNASEYCKNRVRQIIRNLAGMPQPVAIVSGLAYGIDITAHMASLQGHLRTYAVLGHGLNMIYPANHRHIAGRIIAEGGALISEFPCLAPILPVNFLQRNRIIAGMCRATLVAESALKGGAMATARIAASYNREVLAIPGRPGDKYSEGCNDLIRRNLAALTENAGDVAQSLGLTCRPVLPEEPTLPFLETGDSETTVKKILEEKGCKNIDELERLSGIAVHELTVLLMKLELEGSVMALPGKNYILN